MMPDRTVDALQILAPHPDHSWTYDEGTGTVTFHTGGVGIDQAAIDAKKAELENDDKIAGIKAECQRRIFAELSETTQLNMNARSSELLKIRIIDGSWDAAETSEIADLESGLSWIRSMRTTSNTLEGRLATEPDLDWTVDSEWPTFPSITITDKD